VRVFAKGGLPLPKFAILVQSSPRKLTGEHLQMTEFRIEAEWDAEAGVWVATSPDVPGLVLQGRTHDDLIEKVRLVLPALIEIGVEPEDRLNFTFRKNPGREEMRSLPLAA
jgi:predicted RNase H-like HicB family nuclease